MSKKKPRLDVMLSSTSLDLPEHRKQVETAAKRAEFFVVQMENLGARSRGDAISVSMAMVEEAEVYVGVFGLRYGFRPSDPRNPNDISVTEMEYRRAKELGMPILIFIMSDEHAAPDTSGMSAKEAKKLNDSFFEPDPRGQEKLEILKSELLNSHIVDFFNSPEDLRAKAVAALMDEELKAEALAYHEKRLARAPQPEASAPASKIPYPPILYAFPSYSDQNAVFVGRKEELKQLNQWAHPESKKAMMLIDAIGGMGKSALAWKWLLDSAVPFDGAFWYSFYEGGADMRECIRHALAYVSRQDPDELKGRELPKMLTELETALKKGRYLLILDGLERVLLAYHRWDAAQMQDDSVPEERDHRACTDPQDADVLKRLLACHPSRILITSRLLPSALEDTGKVSDGLVHLQLHGLSPDDARRFWQDKGISWSDEGRLDAFIGQFGRHSLLLKLIGGHIVKSKRSFEKWHDIYGEDITQDKDIAAKRSRILAAAYADLSAEAKKVLSQIAALGNAVDLDTLNVFNPYLPPAPEKVNEPDRWHLDYLKNKYESSDTEAEKTTYKNQIDNVEKFYIEQLTVYQTYIKDLETYLKSRDYKLAIAKFDVLLQELEERGLLWWDKAALQYDLHPVVRGYAFEHLEDRANTFDHIYNYFDAQEKNFSQSNIQSLRDLQNTLAMYNALLGAEKFEAASELFSLRLSKLLIFGALGLFRKAYELLLPLFPNGLTELPIVRNTTLQLRVLNWMGAALDHISVNEALHVRGTILKLSLDADSVELDTALSNYSISLEISNQFAQCYRACNYHYELVTLTSSPEAIAVSKYYLFAIHTVIGNWENADKSYQHFNDARFRLDRDLTIEHAYPESLLYRGENPHIILEALANAEDINQKVRDSLEKRILRWVKGEVFLQLDEITKAQSAFSEAIRMANESGTSYGLAWGGLSRAYLQAGNQQEALRIVSEEEPDDYSAAFVYWKTRQFELAKEKVLKNYIWAWAQGEPYVRRYELERVRGLLKEMGVEEPRLPVWDESKYEPFPYEEEVKAFIEELRQQKEERQRKIDADEISDHDFFDNDEDPDES